MSIPLDIALSQVGVEEEPHGSNWGTKVKEYLAAAGITVPAPWCMAFVVWCFKHAQHVFPVTASCTFLLNWAKEKKCIVADPQPGDIFLLLRAGGKSAFHTGFVTSVGSLFFGTVEGNSNSFGSPEGYEVIRRKRLRRNVAFVRI